MKILTVEELQNNFDEYFEKVEKGETFIIQSNCGNVMLLPYAIYKTEIDDLVRIYTDHEEAS